MKKRTKRILILVAAIFSLVCLLGLSGLTVVYLANRNTCLDYYKLPVKEAQWASVRLSEEYYELRTDISDYNENMGLGRYHYEYDDMNLIFAEIMARAGFSERDITLEIVDGPLSVGHGEMTAGHCDVKTRKITLVSLEVLKNTGVALYNPTFQSKPLEYKPYKFTYEEVYIFALTHELMHIKFPRLNERGVDFEAFKFLYEYKVYDVDDAMIRASGVHFGWRHVEGIRPYNYNAGYQVSRYLAEK